MVEALRRIAAGAGSRVLRLKARLPVCVLPVLLAYFGFLAACGGQGGGSPTGLSPAVTGTGQASPAATVTRNTPTLMPTTIEAPPTVRPGECESVNPATIDSTPNGGFAENVTGLPPNRVERLSERLFLYTAQADPASTLILAFLYDVPSGDFIEFNDQGQPVGCELIDPPATAAIVAAAQEQGFGDKVRLLVDQYWK